MRRVVPCAHHELGPRCRAGQEAIPGKGLAGGADPAGHVDAGQLPAGPLRVGHEPGHAVCAGRRRGVLYPALGAVPGVCLRRGLRLELLLRSAALDLRGREPGTADCLVHDAGPGPGHQPSRDGVATRNAGGAPERKAGAPAAGTRRRTGCLRPARGSPVARPAIAEQGLPRAGSAGRAHGHRRIGAAARTGFHIPGRDAVLHARSGHPGPRYRPLAGTGRLVHPAGREGPDRGSGLHPEHFSGRSRAAANTPRPSAP